jgi:hypothetical protein
MKVPRQVTARSDDGTRFVLPAQAKVKRGLRLTLRNVKTVTGATVDVPGYVEKILPNGYAQIATWGKTRPVLMPVARIAELTR